jgi:curved DNA-binding protein CbpA
MNDPYATLGVSRRASDQELRTAYRKLVQRHHPDHNGGSVESARRFEEIQLAYAAVREQRASGRPASSAGRAGGARRAPRPSQPQSPPPRPSGPPSDIDERLAAMEFELREAQRKREQQLREEREAGARRAREREAQLERQREAERVRQRAADEAREAARAANPDSARRASDEELGYFSTDDSFGKILADARDELSTRFSQAREHPVVQRVSDLIDGLDDLVSQADRRKSRDDS